MGDYCSPVPIPLERVCEAECKTVTYEESKMKVFYISSVKTVIHKKVFSSTQEMKLHKFFFSSLVNLYLVSTGKLYGRGSTDDKGPVLAWLNALEAYQQTNQVCAQNIFCFFTHS